jgi:hypothetical protein
MERSNEQRLIDISFDLVLTFRSHYNSYFKDKSQEEVAKWVAANLDLCGFPTEPVGSSWGILKKV